MKNETVRELLTRLIAVPSVNPAHGGPSGHTGELRMAEEMEAMLTERGFTVERFAFTAPDRPAVLARVPVDHPRYSLMFEIHLDTVGVQNMSVPPFAAEEKDGKIYGRGACDMKGATAALLTVLTPERIKTIRDRGIELQVLCAPDEECGTAGARLLAASGVGADRCIVLEPTCNQPVVAHSGCRWYELTLGGVACHGSEPEKGLCTNVAAMHLLPAILHAHHRTAEENAHSEFGASSLNVGSIQGGSALNIVADQTIIGLDRRVVHGEDPEDFEKGLDALLKHFVVTGQLKSADWRHVVKTKAFATRPDSPLLRELSSAIAQGTGHPATPLATRWVSDAAPLSLTCEDILVWGPGDIAQAHTEDEWIALDQLEEGVTILSHFLDAL